jgi:hypothetical protein
LQWWVFYLLQIKEPEERPIDLSSATFRRLWWRALGGLGLLHMGPPHSLRHSRPSADALAGLDLEQIRRKGRWASPKSVQRYTKGHLLVKQTGRMGEALLRRAEAYLQDPSQALEGALARSLAGSGHSSGSSACRCPVVLSLSKAVSRVRHLPYRPPVQPAKQSTPTRDT